MRWPRSSGILLHLSSLPGPHGVGDLGPQGERFLAFLEAGRQTLWQMLPVCPVGAGNSPYQSPSSFAGNPLLISLDRLAERGWLAAEELAVHEPFAVDSVDYPRVALWQRERLAIACQRFAAQALPEDRDALVDFRRAQAHWLDDHALFMALRDVYRGAPWTDWETPLARRDPHALEQARCQFADRIHAEVIVQFLFATQWESLRAAARRCRVRLIGDLPIFVAHDSADVWAHQHCFQLDPAGRAAVVTGVPPDYFSVTGQLWGSPHYRWDAMADRGFFWWIARLRRALEMFDLVRLDHFRGFEASWEIPADAPSAARGRWAPGPGRALFDAAQAALGPLPLIAEDLGTITPEVESLRDELGAPGMRVLQFGVGGGASHHLPHRFVPHCVVYTGTHDNDTVLGWYRGEQGTLSSDALSRRQALARAYLGGDGSDVSWDLVRAAWGSVADAAIAPLQDVLGLGSEARMNFPGTASGNWEWRFRADSLTDALAARLRALTEICERTGEITGR